MFRLYFSFLNAFIFISLLVTDISRSGVAFSQLSDDGIFTRQSAFETEPLKVFSLGKVHLQPEFQDIAKELNIKAGEPLKSLPLRGDFSVSKKLFDEQPLDGWQADNDGEIFIAALFAGNIPSGLSLEACLQIDCFVYNNENATQINNSSRYTDLMPITVDEIDGVSEFNFVVRSETPILDFSSIMTIDVEAEFFLIYKE